MITKILTQLAASAPPTTLGGVLERMRAIDARLPDGDGVKWFNRLYLRVTEAVAQRLADETAHWQDPQWTAELDIVFANLYFDAFDSAAANPSSAPAAWRPLFACRHRADLLPLQFAMAGMNAHINRDLPVAVEITSDRLGRKVEAGSKSHMDYLSVNAILERVESQVKAEFLTGLAGVADEALGRADDVAAMWSVSRARDAAWTHAEALWALRPFGRLHDDFLTTLDRFTGFAGRGLLNPVGF